MMSNESSPLNFVHNDASASVSIDDCINASIMSSPGNKKTSRTYIPARRPESRKKISMHRQDFYSNKYSKRKSLSLENLVDHTGFKEPVHQHFSVTTLHSQDSGLSQSASHQSLTSIDPDLASGYHNSKQKRAHISIHTLEAKRTAELEALVHYLARENADLTIKLSEMQIELASLKFEQTSRTQSPEQFCAPPLSKKQKSRTFDGTILSLHRMSQEANSIANREPRVYMSEPDETSTSNADYSDTVSEATSSKDTSHVSQIDTTIVQVQSQNISGKATETSPRGIPIPQGWQEVAPEVPLPSSPGSSCFTLDKSFQLISDSSCTLVEDDDCCEILENTQVTSSPSSTAEIAVPTTSSLQKEQHVLEPTPACVDLLPQENSTSKVQRWQEANRYHAARLLPVKQKLTASVTSSGPLPQRLHSPQHLSLLSARPFQKQIEFGKGTTRLPTSGLPIYQTAAKTLSRSAIAGKQSVVISKLDYSKLKSLTNVTMNGQKTSPDTSDSVRSVASTNTSSEDGLNVTVMPRLGWSRVRATTNPQASQSCSSSDQELRNSATGTLHLELSKRKFLVSNADEASARSTSAQQKIPQSVKLDHLMQQSRTKLAFSRDMMKKLSHRQV